MPHLGKAAGSIDSGRFIQFAVDAGDSRKIDDGAPPGPFPEIDNQSLRL